MNEQTHQQVSTDCEHTLADYKEWVTHLEASLVFHQEQVEAFQREMAKLKALYASAAESNAQLEQQRKLRKEEKIALEQRIQRLEGQNQRLKNGMAKKQKQIEQIKASLSWRLGNGVMRRLGWVKRLLK